MYIDIPDELKEQIDGKIDPSFGIKKDISIFQDALEDLHVSFFDIYENDDFETNDLIGLLEVNDEDKFVIVK